MAGCLESFHARHVHAPRRVQVTRRAYVPTLIFQIHQTDGRALDEHPPAAIYAERDRDRDGTERSNISAPGGWHSHVELRKAPEFAEMTSPVGAATARSALRDRAVALKGRAAWFDTVSDVVVLLARHAVLALGARLTPKGGMTLGAVVAATFLVSRVLLPAERLATDFPRIVEARGLWAQLRRVMAAQADPPRSDLEGNPRARLSLANLSARSPRPGP